MIFLGAGGGPPTLQGGSAKGSVNTQNLASPRFMLPPSQEAAPASPSTPQLSKCSPATGSSHPPPVPRRNSLEHKAQLKAHAPLKPLLTGLLPKAPATPSCSKYLSRPGFFHTSADAVPSAWKAPPAPLPSQLQLETPLPRAALPPPPPGRGCHILFQLSAFPFLCPLGCEHSTSHS